MTYSHSIIVYAARDGTHVRFVGHTRYYDRRMAGHAQRGWTVHELARVDDMTTALGLGQTFLDLAARLLTEPDENS